MIGESLPLRWKNSVTVPKMREEFPLLGVEWEWYSAS